MKESAKNTVFMSLMALLFALTSCATAPAKAQGITLDEAIQGAAANIETSLSPGTKAAVLYFTSPSEAFSEYVLEELSTTLVNGRKLMIVDRKNLDAIRAELNFNMSGEVSDESAQAIGRMLGAQSIVFGTLSKMGSVSRFRVKTINTESANIEASSSVNIVNDEQVETLLANGGSGTSPQYGRPSAQTAQGGTTASGSGGTASGGTAAGGSGQMAKAPAGPKNGTYTLWPRPRASKAGLPLNVYIAQIVYSDDYTVFYFTRKPEGDFTDGIGSFPPWMPDATNDKVTLQDMDNPSKFYSPVDGRYTYNGGNTLWSLSFNRLPVKRFKLTSYGEEPKQIFYEIVIPDEPDAQ